MGRFKRGGNSNYQSFLNRRAQFNKGNGFNPVFMPDYLFDFQKELVEWAVKMGRAAIFADCGLGKTPMQLVWAENVVRKTGGKVLILTPLSVSFQTIKEAKKFGVRVSRSTGLTIHKRITITNYEKLHFFNPNDFEGVVCDESSILKNFDGKRKKAITEFVRKKPYRLLCTATAAPNDYIELGTSSEALGYMGFMDMLGRFFKNTQSNVALRTQYRQRGDHMPQWRFKRHAVDPFWRWVCSWARALRRPSDMGYDDGDFILPPLEEKGVVLKCSKPLPGKLFVEPALGLNEQRQEQRKTINERCEEIAKRVDGDNLAVVWCQLNDEGDLLEKMIPDAKQVKGGMSDDKKEGVLCDFSDGNLRVLITKPKIGAFGLNWQHCNYMAFFPSHSYEQYYQGVRRCWRFGQKRPVIVDIITTEAGRKVLANLQRKAKAADKMFNNLIEFMNEGKQIKIEDNYKKKEKLPEWL